MSAPDPSPTLFYDLTSPKSGATRLSYPATDLIHKLLHHTGTDVSSFRRNCQISYRLVEYIRDLYDGINTHIQTAEQSGSWEHYDAYNRAIDPLEEALLNIMEVTEAEREEYLLHATSPEPVEHSIETWIKKSISDWVGHRKKIRECLDGFKTQEEFKGIITLPSDYGEDVDSAKAHDDRTLLQNLLKSIGENESKVERGNSQNSQIVKKVKDSLQSSLDFLKGSPKKSLEDDLSVVTIKCAMVTYGVTELMKDDKVKKNSAMYHRLSGSKIWGTAQTLAANIHDHLKQNKEAPNLSKLKTTYEELEAALTGEVPILMPEAYHKIFSLVGKISRAYHAQSLVLASLCQKVALHFNEDKNFEARDALEKALDKTIQAFVAAGGLNSNPATNGTDNTVNGKSTNGAAPNGAVPELSGAYDKSCEELYNESLNEIILCHKTMKMEDEPDLQQKLEEARVKDQKRLELYRARMEKFTPAQELIHLTLIVYNNDSNGSATNKLHAQVLPTARLSYIKWIASKELTSAEISRFEDPTQSQRQPIPFDTEVKSLAKGSNCTLNLIVQKPEGVNESQ